MFCKQCGKEIPKDSTFCPFCGIQLKQEEGLKNKDNNIKAKEESTWDVFVRIIDSKGDEWQSFVDDTSDAVWDLLDRIAVNNFEKFIEEYKEDLNKQPYKTIEYLKTIFKWCATEGYWSWYAFQISENKKLGKLKIVDVDRLIKDWQKELNKHDKAWEAMPKDAIEITERYVEIRINTLLSDHQTMKDLTNEIIEKLRFALYLLMIWGFYSGLAESNYRSKK